MNPGTSVSGTFTITTFFTQGSGGAACSHCEEKKVGP